MWGCLQLDPKIWPSQPMGLYPPLSHICPLALPSSLSLNSDKAKPKPLLRQLPWQNLQPAQTTQTVAAWPPTDNYLIVTLRPPPKKEGAQVSFTNIHCMNNHVALRHMPDFMPASTYNDKASLPKYLKIHPNPKQRNQSTLAPEESGLWKLFPVISLLASNTFYFVQQPHLM